MPQNFGKVTQVELFPTFSRLAFMGMANGIQVDPSEPSVLSLVERSPLVILQQLVTTGPAGWSLASSHSPKRGRAHPPLWLQWGWAMLPF